MLSIIWAHSGIIEKQYEGHWRGLIGRSWLVWSRKLHVLCIYSLHSKGIYFRICLRNNSVTLQLLYALLGIAHHWILKLHIWVLEIQSRAKLYCSVIQSVRFFILFRLKVTQLSKRRLIKEMCSPSPKLRHNVRKRIFWYKIGPHCALWLAKESRLFQTESED